MTAKNNHKDFKYSDITKKIIRAFYTVYNTLGYGFLEKVYENALIIELKKLKLFIEKQKPIYVYYNRELVGEYFADLTVNKCVIIEIKSVENLRRTMSIS